jgi:hypothetical protein
MPIKTRTIPALEARTRFEVVDRIRRRVPLVPDREVQEDVRAVLKHVRRRRRA